MDDAVELVVDAHAALAESPVWDERTGKLVWVDLLGGVVHFTDVGTGADVAVPVGQMVGAVALCEGGGLLIAIEEGFAMLDAGRAQFEVIAPIIAADPSMRMNDGKVDPAGRFWAASMAIDESPGAGTLYRLDPDRSATSVLDGLTIPNGLDWSEDRRSMVYVDTATSQVDLFTYDDASGMISDRRTLVAIDPRRGFPDGLTLDQDGFVWVALFDGWGVERYSPDGRLDRRINVPAAQCTSVAFGGPNYEDLFITTGQEGFPHGGKADQPHAGGVFRCRPGVRGRPTNRFFGA
ncbi:MAG TPA: SMP-30/gluconolactonase/LRE family protein [Candidatus Limnocylindrales bacterium]|nr:SMP-30/gluconolactonase/LRE family protein [Candidatus Limnocylindrales bacterium]